MRLVTVYFCILRPFDVSTIDIFSYSYVCHSMGWFFYALLLRTYLISIFSMDFYSCIDTVLFLCLGRIDVFRCGCVFRFKAGS